MANDSQSQRDIAANNVIVTLGGQELPRPLSVELGNKAAYHEYDENDHPSFVAYRPTGLRMTFPITKSKILRTIGGSEDEMKKDYQMAVRFMAAAKGKPLTVTNLQNVRFTSIVQVYPGVGKQPFEEVIGEVQHVTHEH